MQIHLMMLSKLTNMRQNIDKNSKMTLWSTLLVTVVSAIMNLINPCSRSLLCINKLQSTPDQSRYMKSNLSKKESSIKHTLKNIRKSLTVLWRMPTRRVKIIISLPKNGRVRNGRRLKILKTSILTRSRTLEFLSRE